MTLEELQAEVLRLKEENKNLTQERDTLKTSVTENSDRITSLQEHNQKLFLRLTSEPEKDKEEEKTLTIDELAGELLKGGSK